MAADYIAISLPQKPRLVPWVTVVDLGDERLQFRAPQFVYTLQSDLFIQAFELISPLLDGSHTVKEITSGGGSAYLPDTILFLLKILRRHGLLQEGSIPVSQNLASDNIDEIERQLSFLSKFNPDSFGTISMLQQARVGLVGSAQLKNHILNSIESISINQTVNVELVSIEQKKDNKELIESLNGLDILIACQETEGFGFFETINELCLETGTRWLRVAIEGAAISLGPTFVPFQTACYTCFSRRLISNLPDSEDYMAYRQKTYSNNGGRDAGYFPPLWSLAASHVTLEVARIVSGLAPPQTMGRFYRIDEMSPAAIAHDVLRLPRCPACAVSGPKKQAWDRSVPS